MLFTPVVFADLAAEVAKCSTDKNSITRLACYDKLSSQVSATDPSRSTANVSKWQINSETSKIDDSKNVYLTLEADSPVEGWPRKRFTPVLHIRCKERKTEIYIVTGMAPTVEYGVDSATVTLRIDKQPAFKLAASKSTDGEALFLPQPAALAKRLFGGQALLFQFIPFNSSGQMTGFDIRGLAEAIRPLREACKW